MNTKDKGKNMRLVEIVKNVLLNNPKTRENTDEADLDLHYAVLRKEEVNFELLNYPNEYAIYNLGEKFRRVKAIKKYLMKRLVFSE